MASERNDLGITLSSLQQVMSQVTSFINDNQTSLGALLPALQSFTGQIVAQQQQLGQAFDEGGLVLQNLNDAIVTQARWQHPRSVSATTPRPTPRRS